MLVGVGVVVLESDIDGVSVRVGEGVGEFVGVFVGVCVRVCDDEGDLVGVPVDVCEGEELTDSVLLVLLVRVVVIEFVDDSDIDGVPVDDSDIDGVPVCDSV